MKWESVKKRNGNEQPRKGSWDTLSNYENKSRDTSTDGVGGVLKAMEMDIDPTILQEIRSKREQERSGAPAETHHDADVGDHPEWLGPYADYMATDEPEPDPGSNGEDDGSSENGEYGEDEDEILPHKIGQTAFRISNIMESVADNRSNDSDKYSRIRDEILG